MNESLVKELEGPRHAIPRRHAEGMVLSVEEAIAARPDGSARRLLIDARTLARRREIPLGGPADIALNVVISALKGPA